MSNEVRVENVVEAGGDKRAGMRGNFSFFGGGIFLYSCFYAFCMFHNPSGVTFPFFIAGSLLFGCLCLSKLGLTLRKGSSFYIVSMMLLAASVFCTDDTTIINLSKLGIFLLGISLMLNQFCDTSKWQLGKYFSSGMRLLFGGIGELGKPFEDANTYRKTLSKGNKVFYVILGCLAAIPLFVVVFLLLSSADAVFREAIRKLFQDINGADIFQILVMVGGMFLAVYCAISYLCGDNIKEEVKDKRTGEPVLAITVTVMLTVLYLIFSVIQIVYLFLGQMELPAGYTYARYAREGFFQLLAVSALNLVIVLCCLAYFKESKTLKAVLMVMSLCTFIMITSSALRMIIYIQYYYLTFLRIFVLWALVVLALLFTGVVISIFRGGFPLFRYCCVAVTCCYLVLAFSHPDYWIAKVNVANVQREVSAEDGFFKGDPYEDTGYLAGLSADAAPVLVPWLEERYDDSSNTLYIHLMNNRIEEYDGLWQFNVSRCVAAELIGGE